MDDLEQRILTRFNPSISASDAESISYLNQVKDSPAIFRICFELIRSTGYVEVKFWCMQSIRDVLTSRYASIDPEELGFVRESVASMAVGEGIDVNARIRVLEGPEFIKMKLAQVIVTFIYLEYPAVWSSVFLDFLHHFGKGAAVIDMFCRVLITLDVELISMDCPRSSEEIRVSGLVKDSMRQQCVPQIVRAWYDVISIYGNSESQLCCKVLDAMRRFVSWIDIGLVANEAFLQVLFELVLVDGHPGDLRAAAADCLSAIVAKRMDPKAKISMLRNMRINRVFALVVGEEESKLGTSIALLLVGYATEILECSKKLESENVYSECTELMDEVLPAVFCIMQHAEDDTAFGVLQFLSGYVSTMKSLSPLREKQILYLRQILEVIRGRIRYDPAYRANLDLPDKSGMEEEDRMMEYRKDLFVLLRSIGRISPDLTQSFIRSSLASVLGMNEVGFEDVEVAISLFYALGESMNEVVIKSGNGLLADMISMLLSAKLSCHSHRLVALAYLETLNRYVGFVHENTQYIPLVLGAFLDERGIHHPNINVSRRASYIFMRIVKVLRVNLLPFIEIILQSLQNAIVRFTQLEMKGSGPEDGSHIFEAIGLLIGMEDVSPEKQSDYLSLLLVPLCGQVEMLVSNAKSNGCAFTTEAAQVQQIILAINSLSKGFSERLVTGSRPAIGMMFKKTLDVLLEVLAVFPQDEHLRTKVISFLHRMIDTLGASVFPYLPRALEQLLVDIEPKELVGFLVLINQLIMKFKTAVGCIVEEIFPSVASRVFHVLPKDGLPSGPGSNTEEVRELQELQKTLFTFLHVVTTYDLSSVFLAPNSRPYLESVIQLLMYTVCSHKDTLVRKLCVQVFVKLIRDWCTKTNGEEEKLPGFRNFIIETFSPHCCLYSVLDNSFELRDANTLVLLGEIVTAQKVMYENLGDEFLIHFLTKSFPAAHCPQTLAEQYCQRLQSSDIKALKSHYRSLIENLRGYTNGNLVYR